MRLFFCRQRQITSPRKCGKWTERRFTKERQDSGACKKGIRGFDWPPSSPDLNSIEKIWRWMKNEITKLENVPTSIEDMKEVLQELWNEVDPKEWRYLMERLTCKLEDVIECKGMATVH